MWGTYSNAVANTLWCVDIWTTWAIMLTISVQHNSFNYTARDNVVR